jgi:hypothetical protein
MNCTLPGVVTFGLIFSLLVAMPSGSARNAEVEPATTWFEHAHTLMSIREPGGAPFRMKVTFHGYPGIDFSKEGKSKINTGDGTYEEIWLSPEMWRREVIFPGYHAVEVEADGARRYQSDSDYEPSRVLMMLDALLYPVPINWFSPEYKDSAEDWKIEHLMAGTMPYVALTHRERGMNSDWFYFSYAFLPSGILVYSNYLGLVTRWDKGVVFAGKLVPLHFEIQAMKQTLLTADVTITQAGKVDTKLFDLVGPPASPGMTMRPFHMFEIRRAEYYDPLSLVPGPSAAGVIREIIDRKGQVREAEVIDGPAPGNNENLLNDMRTKRFYPAKVDGDACEETFWIKS